MSEYIEAFLTGRHPLHFATFAWAMGFASGWILGAFRKNRGDSP